MKKQNKGITLIAIVITIIVLLILAGVSIAALTGENGLLIQVEDAKNKTTEAEAIERVGVEVVGSYGTNGKIDIDQLNDNLKKIDGLIYNEKALSESNKITNLPATVNLNRYYITIKSNGGVEKVPEEIAKIIANPTAYYGKKVTNYKDDGNTYRIFYVDKENYFGDGANTIYLKADYLGSVTCLTSYDSSLTKVREMNPLWAKQRGGSEKSWGQNEKVSAWLCDSSKWTTYCDEDKANYAIGGPSVEMYVKSYNEAYKDKINDATKYPIGATCRVTGEPGYIYTINGAQSTISNNDYNTGTDSIDYQNYNSMYCGKDGTKTGSWWLASPCAWASYIGCYVSGWGPCLNSSNYNGPMPICPIVSLKTNFILEVEE